MTKRPSHKRPQTRACPICRHPAVEAFKPFCSKRCTDADLTRWLKGAYAIPGKPASEDDLTGAESATENAASDDPHAPSKPRN